MTENEAIAMIRENCHSGDTEVDHSHADLILCQFLEELGYEELVKEWDKVSKWYA